jgi:uncharacterized membrane protein YfcA
VRLVAIGLVAGFFSALFGVGGGIVVVPLLVMLLAFPTRRAAATSLAGIGITALAGTIVYAYRGEVDVGYALLVGLPAAVGAIVSSTIQQRVPGRTLTLAFAGLLAVIGVWLIAG